MARHRAPNSRNAAVGIVGRRPSALRAISEQVSRVTTHPKARTSNRFMRAWLRIGRRRLFRVLGVDAGVAGAKIAVGQGPRRAVLPLTVVQKIAAALPGIWKRRRDRVSHLPFSLTSRNAAFLNELREPIAKPEAVHDAARR
jgi:hypothetical protein